MNAHSDLNLVTGLWSYNGPAIAAALEASGKRGKVLAAVFDEEEGTLNGIQNGTIQVTVVQKPFEFGYLSSKWMHKLATEPSAMNELPKDKIIDTGVEVINNEATDADSKNVAQFRKELEDKKK
jgi:ribose transport system substrate-binding protein